ncbi:putative basic leucine zipper protein [Lasiodiplodia theobromae]|uniref:Uncharacterized protein n=2 Tax=Lasiodiplodia TaxID=66739 RepID=A0A5N5DIF7_9PEZI|nr:Basic leucine zipper protein [Lasiodiplodia theobromae]KAB2577101.1 hypothetical protein DBV05_g4265 [Lasiodiplodia theobromae]KAF4543728.1 Basic leucine zipper protein [Lasiodiplodia theobromae]KAF9631468.1 putative basic leucine zipper protein [Lasiodiplodia theobromae]KAK0662384.1 hypothetical protein DIS24_g2075 [Lasiodiplodia hormozganensis]
MPRDGSGAGDNAIEAGHNIIHGTGAEPKSDHVDRADKTATPPPGEKGQGIMPHGDAKPLADHTQSKTDKQ